MELLHYMTTILSIRWLRYRRRYSRSYQHNEPKTAPGRRTVFVKGKKKSASKYRLKDCQYLVFSFTLYPPVDGSLNGNVTFRRKKRERDRRRADPSLFFFLPPCHPFLYIYSLSPPSFFLSCRLFPPLEINYSIFFSCHYAPAANNQATRFESFFSRKGPSLSAPLRAILEMSLR